MLTSGSGKLGLLCVDPDEDARAVLELSLELNPHCKVVGVSSLVGATAALSAGVQADAIVVAAGLLLSDRTSPGALHEQAERWNAPVIAICDEPGLETGLAQSAAAHVVIGYISRPFDPLTLADRVRLLLSSVEGSIVRRR